MIDLLKFNLKLPVKHPDFLQSVLQMHEKENGSLFSQITIKSIQASIEDSFLSGVGGNRHKTEGVLKLVTNIVRTLDLVISDLIPILPEEFKVITMFTDEANTMIKEDIKTFYTNNKATISYRDMLTLLSFADKQKRELSKFGVDTSYITEFYTELLKQYSTTMQGLMKEWAGRIHQLDNKADVQIEEARGIITIGSTSWPDDLIDCVSGQIVLALQELGTSARNIVIKTIIEELPSFVSQQRRWLDSRLGINLSSSNESVYNLTKLMARGKCSIPPDRVAAYMNNMYRFVGLLRNKLNETLKAISSGKFAINKYIMYFFIYM